MRSIRKWENTGRSSRWACWGVGSQLKVQVTEWAIEKSKAGDVPLCLI